MDGRVNVGFAVIAEILTFISLIFEMISVVLLIGSVGWDSFSMLTGARGEYFILLVLGIVSAVFQLIVLKQWMDVLNNNINNTKKLFSAIRTDDISVKSEIEAVSMELENEKIPGWPYWGYLIAYVILYLFSFAVWPTMIAGLIGFIMFLIFLHHIFSTSNSVYTKKARAYSYLRNLKGYPQIDDISKITKRNLFLVIVLTVVTFGIYWLYLFIKLSAEINEFVKTDELARTKLA